MTERPNAERVPDMPGSAHDRVHDPATVLVADDDRSIRTVLTQALGRSGYQVRSTGNAGDAVALGGGRRGRPRHHRRGDAGRERARPDPAHPAGVRPGAARRGDERAIDADDGGQGGPARRLRIPAQAVRPEGTAGGGRPRAGAPPPVPSRRRREPRDSEETAAADRPQRGDAGDLPHASPGSRRPTSP